mmetsp:Transcript_35717/g.6441  ORF Transcript_35717/g.6441 Transcript_35717/m.6441 type:complete len:84 (-) Transcript_35717:59-310(-)
MHIYHILYNKEKHRKILSLLYVVGFLASPDLFLSQNNSKTMRVGKLSFYCNVEGGNELAFKDKLNRERDSMLLLCIQEKRQNS